MQREEGMGPKEGQRRELTMQENRVWRTRGSGHGTKRRTETTGSDRGARSRRKVNDWNRNAQTPKTGEDIGRIRTLATAY